MLENLREQRCRILCKNICEAKDYIAKDYVKHAGLLAQGGYDEVVSSDAFLSDMFIDCNDEIDEILQDDEPQNVCDNFCEGTKMSLKKTIFGACGDMY